MRQKTNCFGNGLCQKHTRSTSESYAKAVPRDTRTESSVVGAQREEGWVQEAAFKQSRKSLNVFEEGKMNRRERRRRSRSASSEKMEAESETR